MKGFSWNGKACVADASGEVVNCAERWLHTRMANNICEGVTDVTTIRLGSEEHRAEFEGLPNTGCAPMRTGDIRCKASSALPRMQLLGGEG